MNSPARTVGHNGAIVSSLAWSNGLRVKVRKDQDVETTRRRCETMDWFGRLRRSRGIIAWYAIARALFVHVWVRVLDL